MKVTIDTNNPGIAKMAIEAAIDERNKWVRHPNYYDNNLFRFGVKFEFENNETEIAVEIINMMNTLSDDLPQPPEGDK